MNYSSLIGRDSDLFKKDVATNEERLRLLIASKRFLVVGGAGSIGRALTKEIFKRDPRCLHVVDISENNLVELVRDLRSSIGYGSGDFQTFAIDCGSLEMDALVTAEGPYDFIFNLSALKHVRSEEDPFTLMRMVSVNIFNTIKLAQLALDHGAEKYFCVSTDKAANPVNMMGASKRIMEMFLMRESANLNLSMARFANVAFSDGSLLHGIDQRFLNRQPFAAPVDIRRYFVTPQESGELCLLSGLLGDNRNIFFPKLSSSLDLITFPEIIFQYLRQRGYEPYECSSESEARNRIGELIKKGKWPCYYFQSDTTGEKYFEEFYTEEEDIDFDRFETLGVILNKPVFDSQKLDRFTEAIQGLRVKARWEKSEIISLFYDLIPNFDHKETGKFLNQKM